MRADMFTAHTYQMEGKTFEDFLRDTEEYRAEHEKVSDRDYRSLWDSIANHAQTQEAWIEMLTRNAVASAKWLKRVAEALEKEGVDFETTDGYGILKELVESIQ